VPGQIEDIGLFPISTNRLVAAWIDPSIGPKLQFQTSNEFQMKLSDSEMKRIRAAGPIGPPLPIALTKEQDDELVRRGILPPKDNSTTNKPPTDKIDDEEIEQ
jgi:hypothetical protein